MLKASIRWSRIGEGRVYWVSLRGSFFGIRYLYLWYNQTNSVSKDWVVGSMWFGIWRLLWYCFHNHCSLEVGIEKEMSFIVFVYVGIFSVDIYSGDCGGNVIFRVTFINEICKRGMIIGGVTNLVSLCWSSVRSAWINSL